MLSIMIDRIMLLFPYCALCLTQNNQSKLSTEVLHSSAKAAERLDQSI